MGSLKGNRSATRVVLSFDEQVKIRQWYSEGVKCSEIARRLNRPYPDVITRYVNRTIKQGK